MQTLESGQDFLHGFMYNHEMSFPSMVELLPECSLGVAKIDHFELSPEQSRWTAIRGRDEYVPAGNYARLRVNGQLVMTDTRIERITNADFVLNARGDVLVAGLGLGMILHPALALERVNTITVVEKYADVIALVGFKHPKLTLVHADIHEWKPVRGVQFDTIYFDIWAEQSTDVLEEMKILHRRFRAHKKPEGWMESWRRDYLRSEKRRQRNRW